MKKCETTYGQGLVYVKIFSDDCITCTLEMVKGNLERDVYKKDYSELILDIAECSHLDSLMLGKIFSINKLLIEKGRRLTVTANDQIILILNTISTNTIFNVQNYFDIIKDEEL